MARKELNPGLPEIRDDAAKTPTWLPILGLVLLLAAGAFAVVQIAFKGTEESENLAPVDGREVFPGDRLILETPGGGGYGKADENSVSPSS